MFYLKYRPQKFSELVRPNSIADALANQVKNNRLSHAYLFVGPRGTGKTTTARLVAKAANCTNILPNGDPCNECESCLAINRGSFIDLIEIDAASNRGIDDIRSLRDRIGLAPSQGTKKVYIIDEVHMLTKEAFNALLKTLEEPPEHAIFVLCTTEPHKVLDTIKSRCQVFNFKRATIEQLVNKLALIAEGEGADLPKDVLRKIAQASFGGYRDAETMLQQIVQGSLDPESLFGFASYDEFYRFMNFLMDLESGLALDFLEGKYNEGADIEVWSYALLEYLKELLFLKMETDGNLLDVTEDLHEKMQEQSERISVPDLIFCTRKFLEARNQLSESNIAILPMELAVAEICTEWGENIDLSSDFGPRDGGDKRDNGDKTSKKRTKKSSKKASSKSEKANEKSSESLAEDTISTKDKASFDITSEEIKKKWNEVLRASRKYNHSVRALLKASSPIEVRGSSVLLEVEFAFHKDRLEYTKNRTIVETVFKEVFDIPLTLSCCVKENKKPKKGRETGNLTDLNLSVPDMQESEVSLDDSLLEVFDGGLPDFE